MTPPRFIIGRRLLAYRWGVRLGTVVLDCIALGGVPGPRAAKRGI